MWASLLSSIASGFANAAAALAVKVVMWTVMFDIFFTIFHLILMLIVFIVMVFYLISIISLLFNIPYFLMNAHTAATSLLPFSVSDLQNATSSNTSETIKHTVGGLLGNDLELTTFNSIFGWLIIGGSAIFLFMLIIFIFARAFMFSIGRFFNQRKNKTDNSNVKWAYAQGENPVVYFFKGVLIVIITVLGLGAFYAVLSVAVLLLCFGFALAGEVIIDSAYNSMYNQSSTGEVISGINSSFNEPANIKYHVIYLPTVFGSLINPFNYSDITQSELNAGYSIAIPVTLPVYLFYEVFHFAGFDPQIPHGALEIHKNTNGTYTINPDSISLNNWGDSIKVMGSSYLADMYGRDSWAGIGFIALPWWLIILAMTFFVAAELTKVFFKAIQRVFVLVVYFLIIIVMAFYSLADGGKQWWRFIISAMKWFSYNGIYVFMLNLGCLLIFLFILIGKIIMDDTVSALHLNDGLAAGLSLTFLNNTSMPGGLKFLSWMWRHITDIISGFSIPNMHLFQDVVMLIVIWFAVAGTKHIVFKNFNNKWFTDQDPAQQFFNDVKTESKQMLIYAGAAAAIGYGALKIGSSVAYNTVGRVGERFQKKVADWGQNLKDNAKKRRAGAEKASNLYARDKNGRVRKVGTKVGDQVVLNKKGSKLDLTADGKLRSGLVSDRRFGFEKGLNNDSKFAGLMTNKATSRGQYKAFVNSAKGDQLNGIISNQLSKGGHVQNELREIFNQHGANIGTEFNGSFNDFLSEARNSNKFNETNFFDTLKTKVGEQPGDRAKNILFSKWVADPNQVLPYANQWNQFASKHFGGSNAGVAFNAFGDASSANSNKKQQQIADKYARRRTPKSFLDGAGIMGAGLAAAVVFSALSSDNAYRKNTENRSSDYFSRYLWSALGFADLTEDMLHNNNK